MRITALAACLVLLATEGRSYVELVHRKISEHAFDALQIDFRSRLGVAQNARISGREAKDWLADGSEHEDVGLRPLNHFLDPVHDRPLTVGVWPACSMVGTTADRWALDGALNSYDLSNAQFHYRAALVGRSRIDREEHMKEMFFTLGHVIHLIQDMAQPEHVRNDQHLSFNGFVRYRSLYEAWGVPNISGDETADPPVLPLVDFGGYPAVRLPDYTSYFRTDDRTPDGRRAGRGLTDFANRSFVTQDTNYGDRTIDKCYVYDDPREHETTSRTESVSERVLNHDGTCCAEVVVLHEILTSEPVDYYLGVREADPFHTFFSAVDLETRKYDPTWRVYSLGDPSFLTRASMLIPRAVGYSAGLIERFFRGNVGVEWGQDQAGRWNLTMTNLSSDAIGSDAHVKAVYRARPSYFGRTNDNDTGLIVDDGISTYIPTFAGLAPGASVTLHDLPVQGLKTGDRLPDFERRIAVSGRLGRDTHAVIGLVQPGISAVDELTFRVFWNDLLPVQVLVKEISFTSSDYYVFFEAASGRLDNRWPESAFFFNQPLPSPIAPSFSFSPAPAIFTTTRVPSSKQYLLQIWVDMGSFYWIDENLTVDVVVDGNQMTSFECEREANLATSCRYTFTCQSGSCTFVPAPW